MDLKLPRASVLLTLALLPLAALASGWGVLAPGIYRDPAWLVPQARGQDAVTLLAVPLLAVALARTGRGSARAQLVYLGLLSYMAYTWIGAAFAYAFNELFLVYVAAFSCSVLGLGVALARVEVDALAAAFGARCPRRSVSVFLAVVAVGLSILWLGQIVPSVVTGEPPPALTRSGGSLQYVFALDLGVVVPLAVLSAVQLWNRRPWGYVLGGVVLVKAATMGLALLSMTLFAVLAGEHAEAGLFIPWIVLTVGSLSLAIPFFASVRGPEATR